MKMPLIMATMALFIADAQAACIPTYYADCPSSDSSSSQRSQPYYGGTRPPRTAPYDGPGTPLLSTPSYEPDRRPRAGDSLRSDPRRRRSNPYGRPLLGN